MVGYEAKCFSARKHIEICRSRKKCRRLVIRRISALPVEGLMKYPGWIRQPRNLGKMELRLWDSNTREVIL